MVNNEKAIKMSTEHGTSYDTSSDGFNCQSGGISQLGTAARARLKFNTETVKLGFITERGSAMNSKIRFGGSDKFCARRV